MLQEYKHKIQGLKKGATLQDGRYRIEEVLGQGAFGITYLAVHVRLNKKIAIKEFFMGEVNSRNEDSITVEGSNGSVFTDYRRKFRREAENLANLRHPNIVNVSDIFDENGTSYYVMDFIEGTSLDGYIGAQGHLSEKEAIAAIIEIGKALEYMHSKRMLHLDIKPGNVMRDADGRYCLIDFGLSKQFSEDGNMEASTAIGAGTPGYAPLEQITYKKDGTFPSTLDVYALGATLYKMLTGKRPPEAAHILNEGFPKDDLSRYGISENTVNALEKAMMPNYKKRYQIVHDFLTDLEEGNNSTENSMTYEKDEKTSFSTEKATVNAAGDPSPSPAYEVENNDSPVATETIVKKKPGWKKPVIAAAIAAAVILLVFLIGKSLIDGGSFGSGNIGLSAVEMFEKGKDAYQRNDFTEAVEWYRKAAEKGDSKAQCNLGQMFEKGEGVPQDYSEALKWYQKAVEQDDSRGQNNLGAMYQNGLGVSQDYSEAVKLYRKAADQGFDVAQSNLGWMYENGLGVSQDYSTAVEWYRKSAEQGYAAAQNNLGAMYQNGTGIKQNYSEALKWYRKAAEQENALAQNNLGVMYADGLGIPQDYSEAERWFRKAAEQEENLAQNNLGWMYENGLGVSMDYSEAVKWYSMAANQGNASAQCRLASMYYYGDGISQNYYEAEKWFREAAEKGDADAQYNLGVMYQNGDGIPKDLTEARIWYEKAAAQGHKNAVEALNSL